MKRIPLLCLILSLVLWGAVSAGAKEQKSCFAFAGERLVFDIGWEFVNAGTAVMQVSAPSDSAYRVITEARTNKFLDLFKKVRDTIEARGVCLDGRMQSTVFDLRQHERRYRAVKKTRFDWQHNTVHYTHKGKTEEFKVAAGTLSVMDAFFLVRAMPLKPGDVIRIPVFDSRKTYQLLVHVAAKTQKLFAPWGKTVETLIVEPRLKTAGVFSSKGKIKIWMTMDQAHVPLKMTAKIKIGRIVGHLTDYRSPSE